MDSFGLVEGYLETSLNLEKRKKYGMSFSRIFPSWMTPTFSKAFSSFLSLLKSLLFGNAV